MTERKRIVLVIGLVALVLLLGTGYVLAQTSQSVAPRPAEAVPLTEAAPLAAALAGGATGTGDAGDFLVSTLDGDQENPGVAYNSSADQFLVVWDEEGDIYGQVFSAKGVPQGASFSITTNGGIQSQPAAAYNSTTDDFLVVWTDQRNGLGDIYGQVVQPDGTLPTGEDPSENYAISTATGYQQYPTLAYNITTDEYLVVWMGNRVGNLDIYGQRVDADGTLLGNTDPFVNLAISTASNNQYDPAIAYTPTADEYLVVWVDNRNSASDDIYGQRVDTDGALLGADFAICTASKDQSKPAIAYNSLANEYLVVWGDGRDQIYSPDIYGQRVDAAGTLWGDNFIISDASMSQFSPAVAYNTDHDQYLVVWKDYRAYSDDIYGQRVGSDGTLAQQGGFAISTAIENQSWPAVAYSTTAHQFMVVWEDQRTDEYAGHIHGQRVWWPGLPIGHEFATSSPGTRKAPAVAYDTREHLYLAVWADDADGDFDIYGQFYHRDHYPISSVLHIIDLEGEQTNPTVAYNQHDRNYLVVFEGPGGIGAQLLTAQGTLDRDPFFVWDESGSHWPSVAYTANGDPGQRGFLVLFAVEDNGNGSPAIQSRRITGQGLIQEYGYVYTSPFPSISLGWPDLAYNSTANEFLAVWQINSGTWDILGRRLGYDGFVLDNLITVTDATRGQLHPAATYNPDDNEYMVVWEDYRSGSDFDIYAQRIDADTDILMGGNVPVATSSPDSNQMRPDVIYADTMDRYRIVWQDDRDAGTLGWDLREQWLGADGSNLGTFDAPLVRYLGDQQEPAIAYSEGSLYNQALTVWEDGRSGSDIFGSFGALDDDPPIACFNRAPRIGRAGSTFAFNAWPSRDDTTPRGDLQVRWDLNDDGAWDVGITDKFITHTLASAGVHTVTLGVWDGAVLSDTVSHRIIVLPATLAPSQAPTATLTVSPTWAVAGTTFEFDGSGSSGAGTLNTSWDWEDDGLYDIDWSTDLTAPHTYTVAGDYTIRLIVKDDSGFTNAALQNITVVPDAPTQFEVSLQEVTMTPGEVLHFRATAWDQYGNVMYHPDVTWSVSDPQVGTIDASGIFTASAQAGTYTDVILVQGGVVSDTASVTISWPYKIALPLVLSEY